MQVKEVMRKDVVYVDPQTKLAEVADILFKNKFHGVPVVENNKIVGIITENDFFTKDSTNFYLPSYLDFLKQAAQSNSLPADKQAQVDQLLNTTAKDIMSPHCVTVSPEMELSDFLDLIKKTQFNTFPVADENKVLIGIVTRADVISLMRV